MGGYGAFAGFYSTAALAAAKGHPLAVVAAEHWSSIKPQRVRTVPLAAWAESQGVAKVRDLPNSQTKFAPCRIQRSH